MYDDNFVNLEKCLMHFSEAGRSIISYHESNPESFLVTKENCLVGFFLSVYGELVERLSYGMAQPNKNSYLDFFYTEIVRFIFILNNVQKAGVSWNINISILQNILSQARMNLFLANPQESPSTDVKKIMLDYFDYGLASCFNSLNNVEIFGKVASCSANTNDCMALYFAGLLNYYFIEDGNAFYHLEKFNLTNCTNKRMAANICALRAKCYFEGKGYFPRSIKMVMQSSLQAAELGDVASQALCGILYIAGEKDVPQDIVKAVQFFHKAAEQGYTRAQYNLGVCYSNGTGVSQNDVKAVKLFELAANKGYSDAQFNLALFYEHGRGVPHDYVKAVQFYQQAIDHGNDRALTNLGVIYYEGRPGVPKDLIKAVQLYQRAANKGIAVGLFNLAASYNKGEGVPQDNAKAAELYKLAADKGNTSALFNLGLLYCKEHSGVPKDMAKAAQFFQHAADLGHHGGQYNLGAFYHYGNGVQKDKRFAHKLRLQSEFEKPYS
jgi:TPR repeat protein